jgi:hypothetical protein
VIRRAALVLALLATPALADPLGMTRSIAVVSDPVGNLSPRALPGGTVDYKSLVTNPVGNLLKPVRNLVLSETLPANVVLRVTDLAASGKGPVEFADGNLLGTGLLASGLTYSFTSLGSTGDGLEFFDGTSWSYQPVPDADGYDAKVRAIRVTLTGSFSTATSFQLRYRARIR